LAEAVEPQLGAFAPRRQVAARSPTRITVAHRQDRDSLFVVEGLGVDAHPVAQALAAAVVHGTPLRAPSRPGLADDENSRPTRAGPQYRAGAERQMHLASAAGARR
jgi:hypothetical protein